MLLKVQEHQAAWRAWRDSTLHVHVALPDATPAPSRQLSVHAPPAPSAPPAARPATPPLSLVSSASRASPPAADTPM